MTILFDLDGTLVDTSHDFILTINQVLASRNIAPGNYDQIRNAISLGSRCMLAAALNIDHTCPNQKPYLDELTAVFLENYAKSTYSNTVAFPGINDLLQALDDAKITWGIVTNKHKIFTESLLSHVGYLGRSACVVCGDTTPNPKPAPDPLLHACNLLNVDPKTCIYVGDAHTDILAGKAAGMKTIAAAFGFVPNNVQISEWQADAIAYTPNDIWQWINKWVNITN